MEYRPNSEWSGRRDDLISLGNAHDVEILLGLLITLGRYLAKQLEGYILMFGPLLLGHPGGNGDSMSIDESSHGVSAAEIRSRDRS
jgi:hypothetical protein